MPPSTQSLLIQMLVTLAFLGFAWLAEDAPLRLMIASAALTHWFHESVYAGRRARLESEEQPGRS